MKALLLAGAVMATVACSSEPSAVVAHEHRTSAEPDASGRYGSADASTDSTEPATTVPATTSTTAEPEPVTTVTTRRPVPRATTTTEYEPPSPQGQTTGRAGEPPGGDAPLACIRSYEGDYGTNTGNGYYGAYQFDLVTWRAVGGTGLPSDASPAEQDMRAQLLYDRRGLAPWPTPARRCG